MNTPKQKWDADRSIALGLLRIVFSPLVLRTVLFFLLFLAVLLALVFKAGFSKRMFWELVPLSFIFSVALAFRSLWNKSFAVAGPTVYDKAEYHSDEVVPKGLPHKQTFVHTGMFVGWLIEHDLIAGEFLEETARFKERKASGARVYQAWDGCLISDMLTDEGNAFAKYYYNGEDGQGGLYLDDYEAALARGLPSLYHVKDTWENYDTIKQKIDQRYAAWKGQKRGVV